MKILISSNCLPYPPTSGGELRTHGIVEGLYRAGHEVTLLSFADARPEHPAHIRAITVPPPRPRSRLQRLKTLLFTRQPDVALRFQSEHLESSLRQLLSAQSFDLIQFEGIESAWLLPLAKSLQPQARIAFDTFNAEYALQRSIYEIDRRRPQRWLAALYSWIQIGRMCRYESHLCTLADLVFAVSKEDAALLRPLRPGGQVHVVNSGIWMDRYTNGQGADLGSHTVVFTGSMDYRPNVDAALWFATEIFPTIKQAVPDARFLVIGKDPHPALEPLRQLDGVALTGRVDTVLPYLQGAAAFVAPLRMGSGTRLKLLEAMAAGCIIVATPIAASGLNQSALKELLIADSANQMAATVIDILNNPQDYSAFRRSAQDVVRQYYDWSALIPTLLAAYRSIGLDA